MVKNRLKAAFLLSTKDIMIIFYIIKRGFRVLVMDI